MTILVLINCLYKKFLSFIFPNTTVWEAFCADFVFSACYSLSLMQMRSPECMWTETVTESLDACFYLLCIPLTTTTTTTSFTLQIISTWLTVGGLVQFIRVIWTGCRIHEVSSVHQSLATLWVFVFEIFLPLKQKSVMPECTTTKKIKAFVSERAVLLWRCSWSCAELLLLKQLVSLWRVGTLAHL